MNGHQIRSYLKGQYPYGNAWARKVDKLSDEQVIAIALYLRIVAKREEASIEVSPDQLTLF